MNQSLFTTRYMLGYIRWIKKFQSHCHAVPYLDFINQTIHCTEHIYTWGFNQSISFRQPEDSSNIDEYLDYTGPDPNPGSENIRDRSGSRPNFETDPDPDKNDTDPYSDPGKKGFSTKKILRILLKNAHIPCFVCFYYIFNYHFSIIYVVAI